MMFNEITDTGFSRPRTSLGLRSLAYGAHSGQADEINAFLTMETAWQSGIRYFDTAPWYDRGLAEQRTGSFLSDKPKEMYTISTKVGIIPGSPPFLRGRTRNSGVQTDQHYCYDYSASAVRRSVEESMQRMRLSTLDTVFIQDPPLEDSATGKNWFEHLKTVREEAMVVLAQMKKEGIINAWGFSAALAGSISEAIDSDPDLILCTGQYSLIHHAELLHSVFPRCAARNISLIIGSPLNSGFLTGRQRYNGKINPIPLDMWEKFTRIKKIAEREQVDLLSAALQFCLAPALVSAVIPGSHNSMQISEVVDCIYKREIPDSFWEELKSEGLICDEAPVPVH